MGKENPELDVLKYGRINTYAHDTTPGGSSPFSPPANWQGTEEAYMALMRERFGAPNYAQRMWRAASALKNPETARQLSVTGPYEKQARGILKKLAQ